MIISREAKYLFGCATDSEEQQSGVIPSYLEGKYKIIGAIEDLRKKEECSLYEIAGLMRCLGSSDEEEVRETALRAICEKAHSSEIKKIAMITSSFDTNEDVLTTMLEEANNLDLEFAKIIASRFVEHEDISVSEYARGILKR